MIYKLIFSLICINILSSLLDPRLSTTPFTYPFACSNKWRELDVDIIAFSHVVAAFLSIYTNLNTNQEWDKSPNSNIITIFMKASSPCFWKQIMLDIISRLWQVPINADGGGLVQNRWQVIAPKKIWASVLTSICVIHSQWVNAPHLYKTHPNYQICY